MYQEVICNEQLLALIIRHSYQHEGISFFTPPSYSQQLGYMRHPAGHGIAPHTHKTVVREVTKTQEVLFIRKGRLQVDFYDQERVFQQSEILEAGDVLLLASGGHGFTVLEEVEMFEVKQGPFAGEDDKERFTPTPRPQPPAR